MPNVALVAAAAPLAMAVDIGTSSVRAVTVDGLGRTVDGTESQRPYTVNATADGGVSFPAPALFDLLVACLDDAVAVLGDRSGDLVAVGFTSFWHSLLGVNARGEPAIPILYWADTRSAADAARLRRELPEAEVIQRTGCRFHSSYWPAKLRWLARSEPATFAAVDRWLGPAEFLLGQLAGDAGRAASVSMASGTGMLDVHALRWDEEVAATAGASVGSLPPLNPAPAGVRLHRAWADRWPALKDLPWYPALGDGACANVGSGALGPSRIALTLGTSGAMRLALPTPPGSTWSFNPRLWAYRLDLDTAILGGALSNGGNLLAWLRGLLGVEPDGPLMDAAAALEPDAHGLTVLPFVAGERSPAWHDHANGVVVGLSLSTRPEHLLRAAMEAVAFRLAGIYRDLRPLASRDHTVVANGGAILQSPLWQQIVADALGHTLLALPADDEASARGAAIMALAACGAIAGPHAIPDPAANAVQVVPDPDRHAVYAAAAARQAALEGLLFDREASWDTTPGG
jgi:gluconokinase